VLLAPPLGNSLVVALLLAARVPPAETPLVGGLAQTARVAAGVGAAVAVVEGQGGLVGAVVQGAGVLGAEVGAGGGGVGTGRGVVLVSAAVGGTEARALSDGIGAGGEGAGVLGAEGAGGEGGGVGTGWERAFVLGAEGWGGGVGVEEEGGLVAGGGGAFVAGAEVGVFQGSVPAWGCGAAAAVGCAEVRLAGELMAFVGTVRDGALVLAAEGGGFRGLVGTALVACLTDVVDLADAVVAVCLVWTAGAAAFVVLTVAEVVDGSSDTVL
jgi:hypothetical protein